MTSIINQIEPNQTTRIATKRNEKEQKDHLIDCVYQQRRLFSIENQDKLKMQNNFKLESEESEKDELRISHNIELQHPRMSYSKNSRNLAHNSFSRQQSHVSIFKKKSSLRTNKQNSKNFGFTGRWKINSLKIIYLISKFILIIKNQARKYKFAFLTKNTFDILNDVATNYEYYLFNMFFKIKPTRIDKCIFKLQQFISKYEIHQEISIDVIQPNSTFKLCWDVIVLLFIILNIFYIPVKLSFFPNKQDLDLFIIFDQVPSWILLIDIFINFNTGYYEEGMVNQNRKNIFYHYIKGDFIKHFLNVAPLFLTFLDIPYIDSVLLFRAFRVSSIFENIEDITFLRDKFATVIDLGKLIYINIFISHLCACAWHFIGVIQMSLNYNTDIWLVKYGLEYATSFSRYINSIYWSTITTSTVGYGDIFAVFTFLLTFLFQYQNTEIEMIFVTIMVIITSIVFGYTISSIGSIFAQIREKNDNFKNKMAQVNKYINKKISNSSLQMKTRNYFEHYFKNEQKQDFNEFLNMLNDDLKSQIKVDLYKQQLLKCTVLQENFTDQVIEELCQKVETIQYSPGDSIFKAGDTTNKLIFVMKGQLLFCFNFQLDPGQKKTTLQILDQFLQGSVIGAKNFILQQPHRYCGRATVFTEIAYLEWDEFLNIIKEEEIDFQKYHLIRENLLYNPYFKKILDMCLICKSNHNFTKCPFIFYTPKINLSQSNRIKTYNKRTHQVRKYQKGKNYLKDKDEIQEKALLFALDHKIFEERDLDEQSLFRLGLVQQLPSFYQEMIQNQNELQECNEEKTQKNKKYAEQRSCYERKQSPENMQIIKKKKKQKGNQVQWQSDSDDSEKESEKEEQMIIIKQEYNRFLIEDKEFRLDSAKCYQNYCNGYNLDVILKKFEAMQLQQVSQSHVKIKRKELRLKTQLQGKTQLFIKALKTINSSNKDRK